MIKIMVTIRNRFEISKKCIEALLRHTNGPRQIYVYDNLTSYRIKDHWDYFQNLYENNKITQYTCNTKESTFNAFSKAVACNTFGQLHSMDPNKDKIEFLVFMDNDMFVLPDWDDLIRKAWKDVERLKLKNIKIVTQSPGGIKNRKDLPAKIAGHTASIGILGGSGFWTVKNNFFDDVGYLSIPPLVGHDKKHDQMYWSLLSKVSNKSPYIIGLQTVFVLNCGGRVSGSICNVLTRYRNDPQLKTLIENREVDEKIGKQSFEEFYREIMKLKGGLRCW